MFEKLLGIKFRHIKKDGSGVVVCFPDFKTLKKRKRKLPKVKKGCEG